MIRNTIDISKLIAEKIKVRYAQISRLTFSPNNCVVDAFYPDLVQKSIKGEIGSTSNELNALNILTSSCISPFIARELGLYKIPTEDLVRILGYNKSKIKTILSTLKKRNNSLVLVGVGGTGMNFVHWASELCLMSNVSQIFQTIIAYEPEKIELHNIFRFPNMRDYPIFGQTDPRNQLKISLAQNQIRLLSRYQEYNTRFMNIEDVTSVKYKRDAKGDYIEKEGATDDSIYRYEIESIRPLPSNNNTVYYGAPTIESREMFALIPNMKFVSATHGDNDCQLYIRPPQDSSLQVESYGMINLSVFFMNQLKMTIEFLDFLSQADNESFNESRMILDYSFAKEYANKRTVTTGLTRTYNFPILTENFVDQEDTRQNQQRTSEEIERTENQSSRTTEVVEIQEETDSPSWDDEEDETA